MKITVLCLLFSLLALTTPCCGWPPSVDNLNAQAAVFNTTLADIKKEITPAATTLNSTVNALRTSLDTNVEKLETTFNPSRLVFYSKNIPIMGLGFVGGIFALIQLYKDILKTIEQSDPQKPWLENIRHMNKKTIAKLIASSVLLTTSLLVIGNCETIVKSITCR